MSMYRQLWLAIIVSMLLALVGSLLASLLSARSYLEQQLSMKNADNASALALSLSQQNPDRIALELAVAALFDSGHYESIRINDPHGKLIVERVAAEGDQGAPAWFVERLPIRAEPGEAQITNGWTQLGTVTLVSHSRFGYQALWTSTQEMVATLTLASLIGGYLGSLILRRLRHPLQTVIDQAVAITNRRFVTIPEPEVPELHKLAEAMNLTVSRLKTMFEEEAARLEALRREANFDKLTGLANRDYLIAELRSTLEEENADGGSLLLIRVADLVGINRRLGRETTDEMLRRFGSKVGAGTTANFDSVAARMNGADFALLLRGRHNATEVATTLLQDLIEAMEPFVDGAASAYIGLGSFRRDTPVGAVLSQVDAALIAAEADGVSGIREAEFDLADELPETIHEWSRVIREALQLGHVRLVEFPVMARQGGLLHVECPLRLKLDEQGEWLAAGRFLPIAERLGLLPDLDLTAMELGLRELERNPSIRGLAINLSAASLANAEFIHRTDLLLKKHRRATSRLWIEVAETGLLKHLDVFRHLCQMLRGHGCKIGVEHFGRQFSAIGRLHNLGLNYLKIDSSFVRQVDTNPGNQSFLKGACSIAHTIELLVIAEGVTTDAELGTLLDLGFDGATGPGVRISCEA
jgi:diguanylate cyclase (GGDEF)-like protein